MLILSLLVFQVLSGCLCYDVELEGNVKVGNVVIGALRRPTNLVNLLLDYFSSIGVGRGQLPRALKPESIVMRTSNNVTTEMIENKKTDPLEQLINHLQEKGKLTLNDIGNKIKADLNITKNITNIVDTITNEYGVKMQNYYEFVSKSQNDSERDLLYLDIAETSCELLFTEKKNLLNDIIMHDNHKAETANFQNMTHQLLERSYKDKKEAMKYICDTFNVCRPYPAFTDYCVKLISEVLILEDYKFLAVLDTLSKILKQNEKYFARITEKEDRELIKAKLGKISNNLSKATEFFIMVRSVLTHRFKTVSSGGEEFKIRSKATRIILDIVDKALTPDDDILAIDFHQSVRAIRGWSVLERSEFDRILEDFANSLFRKLQHNLTKHARQEIKVLIKTIMRGNTEDDEVFQRLFKFGSKYVKNEDFHSDVDIIGMSG